MSDNYLDDLFIDEVSGALKPPSGSESVKDYAQLTNLPKVNGVELKGEKSLEDLGIDLLSPETKTDEDTQAVKKDSDGKLWTKPSVTDYTQLSSLPKINGVELNGEKTLDDLGIDLLSPETKTAEDTQAVRKDSDGKLWTKPSTVLNVTEKTEADTDYTVEVKIDPVTKKLYVPASTVQTAPTEPDAEEVTE